MNRADILQRLRPTADERRRLDEAIGRLVAATQAQLDARGLPGQATVQGSVAKGTWLRGGGDIDLFLLVDPAVAVERLTEIAQQVGRAVLHGAQQRYAQHPYVVGSFEGHDVDIVPAYRVAAPNQRMSAVDRTPFHTAWVRQHLGEAQRDEVRLLKRWLKGTGLYGAETAVGGFSGYLCEVLVAKLGGLDAVVDWLAGGARPRRLSLGGDEVKDEPAALVVVDPVDATRNCAAAVREDVLDAASQAARAYRKQPSARFFFPNPPRAEPTDALASALQRQGAGWAGLVLTPQTDRLDIVLPQFQRAARVAAEAMARAGFAVRRAHVAVLGGTPERVAMQWVATPAKLPEQRVHEGPTEGSRHARRFLEKWRGHPDAAGPVEAGDDGRLRVPLRVTARTLAAWLESNPTALVGRHVGEARAHLVADLREVEAAWAPTVADVVLDRQPWER